ncbi:MAG: DNA recombination protein RmuC [Bauldia sp.]|nr:DNA recombination protein RmuC [Bauldia sp.]
MDRILMTVGSQPISLAAALVVGAILLAFVVALVVVSRRGRDAALARAESLRRAEDENAARMNEFARSQAELSARMQTIAEVFGSRQAELNRSVSDRLDGLGHRIGQSMTESTKATHENLSRLSERLAVIDRAQANITELSGQVVQLQNVLANKQTRGAFGQARMEAIVQDGLPQGSYSFQATLSNRNRPDCLVKFPNGAPDLVIDAKFPLEAWNAMRADEIPLRRMAEQQFRRDVQGHITAIRSRYFIPGETQDTAFMFVPSESIFGDIHERFEDVIQFAHRNRVVIVSPTLLLLSIQVIQAVLRDTRIKEQAHVVRDEVIRLMDDVTRLDDRVRKLQSHFGMMTRDFDEIATSTKKIITRGEKIDSLDFGQAPHQPELRLAGE